MVTYIVVWAFLGLLGGFLKWAGDELVDYKWDNYDLILNGVCGILFGPIWFFLGIGHFWKRHCLVKKRYVP